MFLLARFSAKFDFQSSRYREPTDWPVCKQLMTHVPPCALLTYLTVSVKRVSFMFFHCPFN